MSDNDPGTPGTDTGLGIVLIDEPEHCSVAVFAERGEVLLTFDARPGADFSQVLIGLTPKQVLQLQSRLRQLIEHAADAVREGRGGRGFRDG